MRLEIVVSKGEYHYWRVALVEVKPSWPADKKLYIGFKSKHMHVLECRKCSKTMKAVHKAELQQIKDGLIEMGLQTAFFHHRCDFHFASLVKMPLEKRNYWLDRGNEGNDQWIIGYKELGR